MTSESQGVDPYEAVLADLKAKRAQIDQTIQALESLRSGGRAPQADGAASEGAGAEGPGAFLGMTIADAAKRVLEARRKPLGNAELAAALTKGGLVMQSADPLNTVGSVLTRRFNQVGDIVRVSRGVWGLASWYPNRSFKRKPQAREGEAKEGPEAPPAPEGEND